MKYIRSTPIHFTDPDSGRSSSGHKFHNWITGLYLSKLFDLTYVYSPFTQDAERYEDFLNLAGGYPSNQQVSEQVRFIVPLGTIEMCHDPTLPVSLYQSNLASLTKIIKDAPDQCLFDIGHNPMPGMLTQHYQLVMPELQRLYWSKQRDITLVYKPNKISVAIHIRRGDITLNNNPDRWLDLNHYRNIIQQLGQVIGFDHLDILVFSEGNPAYFESLLVDNSVRLKIGGSDLEALHHMASADILVTGRSSFSIMAAYFNPNIVIYTPLKNFMYKWGDHRIMPYSSITTNSIIESYAIQKNFA